MIVRRSAGFDLNPDENCHDICEDADDTGDDTGDKELANRLFGKNTINDKDEGWRDQGPECSTCRNRSGSQGFAVAEFKHFRDGNSSHC